MQKKKKENDFNNHPSDGTVANIKWCIWCQCGHPVNEKCKAQENFDKFWERNKDAINGALKILNEKKR